MNGEPSRIPDQRWPVIYSALGGAISSQLGQATQSLYVFLDDVDRHFQQAKRSGARILEEPQDQFYGDRRDGTEDPEGHHWYFAQHVRDVVPEDMKPPPSRASRRALRRRSGFSGGGKRLPLRAVWRRSLRSEPSPVSVRG